MVFRPRFFFLICLLLVVVSAGFSFHRFMLADEYTVEYEGTCEPETEECFVGCEDDACTEVYYYSIVEKEAADVRAACGPDISECEEAYACLPTDTSCVITYCSPELLEEGEVCENLTEESAPVDGDEEGGESEEEGGEASEEVESDAL